MSVKPVARLAVIPSRWEANRDMSMATSPASEIPRRGADRIAANRIELAAIALDGMQSQRWAAPPTMLSSTSVTRAPRVAAAVAAECPAGPPPMMRKRSRCSWSMGLSGLSGAGTGGRGVVGMG